MTRSGQRPSSQTSLPFPEKARAYWTEERTRKVTAGRPYPILPGEGAVLLRALGLLNKDASMSADAVRKYGQVNHLVTLLEPAFLELRQRFSTVRVLDAGCGSSYLTFLLAWCFEHRWHHPVEIIGVDANAPLITKSKERAQQIGLQKTLRFETGAIADFDWAEAYAKHFEKAEPATEPEPAPSDMPTNAPTKALTDAPPESVDAEAAAKRAKAIRPHAVVALHACDTATDDALTQAIALKADFIAAAPCCQAALAKRWAKLAADHAPGAFAPIWNSPHLRREAAATMTDTLRMLHLRANGYEVTAMEFVPSTHTPKNTLLRAVRRGNYLASARAEHDALALALGLELDIERPAESEAAE